MQINLDLIDIKVCLHVNVYLPKHHGKFLLCENQLGNKPDSDSVAIVSILTTDWV